MAWSYVGAGTESSVASGNMTPGLPAGIQANDILVMLTAQQANADTTAEFSVSANWTKIYVVTSAGVGGGTLRQTVWWHRYDGSTNPGTTVTAGSAGTTHNAARIIAIRGAPTSGDPVNAYDLFWDTDAANADTVADGVRTTNATGTTFHFFTYTSGGGASTIGVSGAGNPTFTKQFQTNFDTTTTALALFTGEKSDGAGPTNFRIITSAMDLGCGGHVALGPPAAGAAVASYLGFWG